MLSPAHALSLIATGEGIVTFLFIILVTFAVLLQSSIGCCFISCKWKISFEMLSFIFLFMVLIYLSLILLL